MAASWTDKATRALLSVWGEQNVQEQLDGVKQNRHIYDQILAVLRDMVYDFSAKQCQTKVKQKYY